MTFRIQHFVFIAFGCLLAYLLASHFWLGSQGKDKKTFQVLVTTQKIVGREINESVEALGTTTANEAVHISATVTAKIEKVHFEDGQQVSKGAVLVELDAAQQRADVEEQRVNVAEAQRQYNHLQKLIERKAVSQTDVDKQKSLFDATKAKLEASQAKLQDYIIRAPFSGVLGVRKVSVGTLVSPGTVITTLDDLSRLKVDFSVPEIFLPYLTEGLPIQATSQTYPGKTFEGSIHFIDSRIDPATRAITLRAYLPNEDKNTGLRLRPGMLINVRIEQPTRMALMIPERAIAPLRGEQFVFVVDENNIAHRRSVQIGQRIQGEVEIVLGIEAGETIVIDGSMTVQDGMNVTQHNPSSP
jgi:membrane fusion protein (multidrug efflux system)